jgi:hypothetical protein
VVALQRAVLSSKVERLARFGRGTSLTVVALHGEFDSPVSPPPELFLPGAVGSKAGGKAGLLGGASEALVAD